MYDREHYYLTFGGTLFQAEQWQCGLKFAPSPSTEITTGPYNTISLTDIFEDLTQWWESGNTGAQIGAAAKLGWCKLAVLDVDGVYKFEPRIHEASSPVTPPVTTVYPAQVAYVVSLWSGQNLGRANHGRFYVPVPSAIVGQTADGLLTTVQAENMRIAAATMINAVAGEVSTLDIPTSPAIMSKLGTGATKPVAQVGVGRVLDTQRRRRNQLSEGTVYSAL